MLSEFWMETFFIFLKNTNLGSVTLILLGFPRFQHSFCYFCNEFRDKKENYPFSVVG